MAERHIVERIDDLNGETGDGVEKFYFVTTDGRVISIDLCESNAATLKDGLEPFAAAGRQEGRISLEKWLESSSAGSTRARPPKSSPAYGPASERREYLQNVREWARKRGMRISEYGRVPVDILAAYDEEHAA